MKNDGRSNPTLTTTEMLIQVVTARRKHLVRALDAAIQSKEWNQVAGLAEILEAIDAHLHL